MGLKARRLCKADLKVKSGDYRGREKLPVPVVVGENSLSTYFRERQTQWWDNNLLGTGSETGKNVSDMFLINPSTDEKLYVTTKRREASNLGWYLRVSKAQYSADTSQFHNLTTGDVLILQTQGDESLCKTSVAGEYTHTDVIGDPAFINNIDSLSKGWIGGWIAKIPDSNGVMDEPYTRPATNEEGVFGKYVQMDSIGNVFSNGALGIEQPGNYNGGSLLNTEGRVSICHYKSATSTTAVATSNAVYGGELGLGKVWASSWGDAKRGRTFTYSLINEVTTAPNTYSSTRLYPVISGGVLPGDDFKIAQSQNFEITHTPVDFPNTSGFAVKALNYNVVKNQQAFVNYAYTQLVDDGIDWGDDGKIHIIDNQSMRLDDNGNTVLYGTAQIVEPLGWVKNDK